MSEIEDLREFLAGWARGDFRTGTRLFADNIRFIDREDALAALAP